MDGNALAPESPLTQEQRLFYQQNGYLVVEDFFALDECSELIVQAEDIARGHYANILNLHWRCEAFYQLLTAPGVLAIADLLQGSPVVPVGSLFFFCKPGSPLENGSVRHQDNYAVKAPHGSYLVVGLPLDDADEGNGALVVYPGSHRLGDLPGGAVKNFECDEMGRILKAYPIGSEVQLPEGYEPLQLSYRAGSLLFVHGHLVHMTAKNPSPTRWRRKVYLHYIKGGDPFWPGWNARRQIIGRGLTRAEARAAAFGPGSGEE